MGEIAPSMVPSDERQVEHTVSSDDVHESILIPVSGCYIACRHRRGDWWQKAAGLIIAQQQGISGADHYVEPPVVVEVSRDRVALGAADADDLGRA